jgi:hypothetical protein
MTEEGEIPNEEILQPREQVPNNDYGLDAYSEDIDQYIAALYKNKTPYKSELIATLKHCMTYTGSRKFAIMTRNKGLQMIDPKKMKEFIGDRYAVYINDDIEEKHLAKFLLKTRERFRKNQW